MPESESPLMTRPVVRKTGNAWAVHLNGRTWNTRKTWADAILHANRIAGYARRIRIQNDINRIHASLKRMEENR